MEVIKSPDDMQRWSESARRAGERVALVPTMGYLHEGHLSLMREGRRRASLLVASVFVNPTQFAPSEDFARYPRDLERDIAMMAAVPVDAVFAPEAAAIYAPDAQTWVEVTGVTGGLCGARRPGHFRGVTTIVAKLFNIVKPHLAIFGEKDFQQLRAIQKMAADERERALALSLALRAARERYRRGACCVEEIVAAASCVLKRTVGVEVEYLEAVDAETLRPASSLERPILLAVAARVGNTRLIDNLVLAG